MPTLWLKVDCSLSLLMQGLAAQHHHKKCDIHSALGPRMDYIYMGVWYDAGVRVSVGME